MMSNTDRREQMAKHLRELINDPSINRNDLRTCIETLITINRNYQTGGTAANGGRNEIRTSNARFHRQVWRFRPARDFLLASGWTVGVGDSDPERPQVIRVAPDKYDRQCLQVLIEHRDVKPNADETSKVLTEHTAKESDQELRRRAREVREKEIKDFKEQKLKNKQLEDNIKKEIIADNKYRRGIQFSYTDYENDYQDDYEDESSDSPEDEYE